MLERGAILGRIREALTLSAPRPGHAHPEEPVKLGGPASPAGGFDSWLPLVGEEFEAQMECFRTQCAELRAEFQLLGSREELRTALHAMAHGEGWQKVATHEAELCRYALEGLEVSILHTKRGYAVPELEQCEVGLTECDLLIAQTGSVVVSSRSAGGRALSILPAHHVVLARREQLVRDLPTAFARLKEIYGAGYPSMISLVTGPSRTGDIERILVLGAHGPKKLSVLVY